MESLLLGVKLRIHLTGEVLGASIRERIIVD